MDNKLFENANQADQRRMVAMDAIAQLNIGKYKAESTYLDIQNDGDSCRVCGIGACLVSMGRMKAPGKTVRQLKWDNFLDWDSLKWVFGNDQLAIIEEFFEYSNNKYSRLYGDNTSSVGRLYKMSIDGGSGDPIWDRIGEAKSFFQGKSPKDRLIQIMENIVRNGEFDYEEEIKYRTDGKYRDSLNTVTTNITDDLVKSFREQSTPSINNPMQHENQ